MRPSDQATNNNFWQKYKLVISTALYLMAIVLPSTMISSDGFSKAVYGLLIILALVNHARIYFWLLLPFLILSPVALYYAVFYKLPTDISFWFLLFGTNLVEVVDFIAKGNKPFIAIAYLSYILIAWFCYKNMTGKYFSSIQAKGRWLLMALILIPLSYAPRNDNVRDYVLDVYRHFRKAYPQNLVLGYIAADLEVQKLKDLVRQPPNFAPKLLANLDNLPATYVLVIGESARRDKMSVYGYQSNTTPNMQVQPDLLIFKDMVSYGYNTSTSIPYLLTKSKDTDMNPSFLDVFKQVGFKVFWLSNQAKYGEFDSLISSYAQSADVVHFMNTHSYTMTAPDNFDENLLPFYQQALTDKAAKKLIILHLYGSHPDFEKRYPASANKFTSAYDNTIYYTDQILQQIINALQQHTELAAMWYISDHGLALGECHVHGHIDAKNSYEVPFLMWFNLTWRNHNPNKYHLLQARQMIPLHTGDLFDTFTDVAGIRFAKQTLNRSFADSSFQRIPRVVKAANAEINYDASQTDESCHLLAK
ncbi:MAG: phosphoethanolamine transferase [Pseudomonadales bacterium]|nr:phosphoethanolamine transferase [Pseudomonadales bacterium]MCB1673196.1 phosphoethanolamine transferase [Pseudomonadales bacterium]